MRTNATKMQNFVNGQIVSGQGPSNQHKPLPYGNLKVKKSGIKTTGGSKQHQMTPQRIKKVKEHPHRTTAAQDAASTSMVMVSQSSALGGKNTAGGSKAQQYLRNSFMIKNHP